MEYFWLLCYMALWFSFFKYVVLFCAGFQVLLKIINIGSNELQNFTYSWTSKSWKETSQMALWFSFFNCALLFCAGWQVLLKNNQYWQQWIRENFWCRYICHDWLIIVGGHTYRQEHNRGRKAAYPVTSYSAHCGLNQLWSRIWVFLKLHFSLDIYFVGPWKCLMCASFPTQVWN